MINYKKQKFSKFDWGILKKHLEGWIGEIHHVLGKDYEYLATLKLMSVEEHRGKGHRKNMNGISEQEREDNLAVWKVILDTDYEYFVAEGLEG